MRKNNVLADNGRRIFSRYYVKIKIRNSFLCCSKLVADKCQTADFVSGNIGFSIIK